MTEATRAQRRNSHQSEEGDISAVESSISSLHVSQQVDEGDEDPSPELLEEESRISDALHESASTEQESQVEQISLHLDESRGNSSLHQEDEVQGGLLQGEVNQNSNTVSKRTELPPKHQVIKPRIESLDISETRKSPEKLDTTSGSSSRRNRAQGHGQ